VKGYGKQKMEYLTVKNLNKSFRRRKVLEDISFSVGNGSIVAVTGENGSGKTTLLNLITGWIKPDRGTVDIAVKFGFCPQEALLFPRLTLRENIQYFITAYGGNKELKSKMKSRSEELMETFGFKEYERDKVSILSGGTKQKLNLVISLLHDPDLMIMDEPYSSLDMDTYRRFWEYASERRKEGKSILIVSHLVYDRSLIDQLYIIKNHNLECSQTI
jgi:ABC-2 type transport system ATP-binding protein